ncbi:hypothetical protein AGLY_008406 [Aphis glycines]|uniref:Uncharacterized protein n=1 Tax=Aphis glycines TaxID=307491 RepID=A0A6G0TL63_APHGL|nr:hypothetical protein AGLY_008406 [Aphis glycines]
MVNKLNLKNRLNYLSLNLIKSILNNNINLKFKNKSRNNILFKFFIIYSFFVMREYLSHSTKSVKKYFYGTKRKKKDSDVNLKEITRHRLRHHHLRHFHLLLPSFVVVAVVVQVFVVVAVPTFDVVVVVVTSFILLFHGNISIRPFFTQFFGYITNAIFWDLNDDNVSLLTYFKTGENLKKKWKLLDSTNKNTRHIGKVGVTEKQAMCGLPDVHVNESTQLTTYVEIR